MIRKLVHNNLNIKAARTYVPYQDLENKAMLLGFLDRPNQFVDHIRRYTNSLTTQMVFGFRTTSTEDPKLKQLYHVSLRTPSPRVSSRTDGHPGLRTILPGYWNPDSCSSRCLSHTPISPRRFPTSQKICQGVAPKGIRLIHWTLPEYQEKAKGRHGKGTRIQVRLTMSNKKYLTLFKPCFCVDLVRAQEQEGFSDGIAGYTSGSLLEAGSDTTSATLVGFVQAMLIFPEVVKAAQEELDRVCGDRLPDLNDLRDLPYIRGCMKESLRWMPTDILGVPHAVIRDDEYMGYKIPKGAGVMWNVW